MAWSFLLLLFTSCGSPEDDPRADKTPGAQAVPATPKLARLTHTQWENTVQDLLGLSTPTGWSERFLRDATNTTFDNHAEHLPVGPDLFRDYQRAAEALAWRVVTEPTLYRHVVPEDPRTGAITSPLTTRAEAETLASPTGDPVEQAWGLWTEGSISVRMTAARPGPHTVSARVWADQAGEDWAKAVLEVDGIAVFTADVQATTPPEGEVLSATVDLEVGTHDLAVHFANDLFVDGQDRNLYVDWIQLAEPNTPIGVSVTDVGSTARDAWIARFGQLAFRRPLEAPEAQRLEELFSAGPTLVDVADDFAAGVLVTVQALLQSPHFLYRMEGRDDAGIDQAAPLTAHELASKLSYALWNTMPDEELQAAAAAGTLLEPTVLQLQAERLLADSRARNTVADFHRQLLLLDRYDNIDKSGDGFAAWTPDLPGAMRAEALAFVDGIYTGGGGVFDLYTSPTAVLDDALAAVYGSSTPAGATQLPPTQRSGWLTRAGFLALESEGKNSSPIRRGALVSLRLLCATLPPPPDAATPLPPPSPDSTTRERTEQHTGQGTCGGACHAELLNPIGFAFENYDGIGHYRARDNGQLVDSSGTAHLTEGAITFDNALELSHELGQSLQAHRCYSEQWLRYLHGRSSAPEDDVSLDAWARLSLDDDLGIRALLLAMVTDPRFAHRRTEVSP